MTTPAELLTFWYGHADPRLPPTADTGRWWRVDPAFDAEVRARFSADLDAAAAGALDAWADTATGALALTVLCDQLPRNVHRGSPLAFAWDGRARAAAARGRAAPASAAWDLDARTLLLLPLEHSEDLADQEACVAAFDALVAAAPPAQQDKARFYHRYAVEHRDIIARFGRFPHRNAALGRADTPDEAAWLAAGAPRFGQG